MKGKDAERAFRRIMEADGWIVHQATAATVRRGPLFITNSNDLWNCVDLAGVHPEKGFHFVQVTGGGSVSARKKKIMAVRWPLALLGHPNVRPASFPDVLRISIAEARTRRDDLDPRRVKHLFRVHELQADGSWVASEIVEVGQAGTPEAKP